MTTKKQVEQKQETVKFERTLGRTLAREIPEAELEVVVGGLMAAGTHGSDDHSPTGEPCSDCD
jgi:hypothetical protein